MIRKQPGGRAALWHQDHAYWQPELDYHALGVWLPMHDVSVEMGAMQFIPGSHKRGLLPHRHEDDPTHNVLTVADAVDASQGRRLPAQDGRRDVPSLRDAALHRAEHHRTSRASPSRWNSSLRRSGAPQPESMPWVDEHRAATGPRPLVYVADGKIIPL